MDDRQKSRHWIFVINNPTEADSPTDMINTFSYYIVQKEIGIDGTKHMQGYCQFKVRQYLTGASKIFPRAHLEIKEGTVDQAIHYCMKPVNGCKCQHCTKARELGQKSNYIEFGVRPQNDPGKREKADWDQYYEWAKNDELDLIPKAYLIRYYSAFKRIRQDNPVIPEDLKTKKNYWIIAPSQYGKSTYARTRWGPRSNIFDKAPNKWFIGYKGQETVLCDDFGPDQCRYLHWYMKRWADLFVFPMETKGGGQVIRPHRVVVTSQYTIEQCFTDPLVAEAIANRFSVINLPHYKKRIDVSVTKESEHHFVV